MTDTGKPTPCGFDHIETWVFDLDNTLYPHHLNLWGQVDARIRSYIAGFLKISKRSGSGKRAGSRLAAPAQMSRKAPAGTCTPASSTSRVVVRV